MKISRRSFHKLALANTVALSAPAWAQDRDPEPQLPKEEFLSIMQGATDESTSQFSVVVEKNTHIDFFAFDPLNNQTFEPTSFQEEIHDFSDWKVVKLHFTGLSLSSNYELICQDSKGSIVDQRSFKLLDIHKPSLRLGLVSCMNDHLHRDYMWHALEKESPELLLFMGDAVYADMPNLLSSINADLKKYWRRFVRARNKLEFYRFKQLIPVLAVWDDHDYGKNNSDRNFPYKEETRYGFETFMAQDNPCSYLTRGPGVSSLVRTAHQDIFLLDGRTYRSEKGAHDETYFGDIQEQWLFNNIDPNKPTWLVSGSQWFGGYRKKESYEYSHRDSFEDFLGRLRQTGGKFLFASGDIHMSEVMRVEESILGYESLEITSSSIHSLVMEGLFPLKKSNPRRIDCTKKRNFFVVDSHAHSGQLDLSINCVKERNRRSFSLEIELFSAEELDLKESA